MKKHIYIILLAVVLSSVLYSCKSHEKCPAYGQIHTEQSTIEV